MPRVTEAYLVRGAACGLGSPEGWKVLRSQLAISQCRKQCVAMGIREDLDWMRKPMLKPPPQKKLKKETNVLKYFKNWNVIYLSVCICGEPLTEPPAPILTRLTGQRAPRSTCLPHLSAEVTATHCTRLGLFAVLFVQGARDPISNPHFSHWAWRLCISFWPCSIISSLY